ncbi:aldehyde dehydrogenase family protein, partial [Staphylococcus saprophyticus]|uniref:aldehyde dehydrogenase family protein n=1 Tax=Staphylococcus saprophyticus TaxID=29385 RepID=UPI0011A51D01
ELPQPLSPHKQLHLLSFTPPIKTPKHIIKQPPHHLTHLPLQLPRKNPNLIFHDPHFDLPLHQPLNPPFFHPPQLSSPPPTIILHNHIKQKFQPPLIQTLKNIKLPNPFDSQTE